MSSLNTRIKALSSPGKPVAERRMAHGMDDVVKISRERENLQIQNEKLVLENLRHKRFVPKLHASVTKLAADHHYLRQGVVNCLNEAKKQFSDSTLKVSSCLQQISRLQNEHTSQSAEQLNDLRSELAALASRIAKKEQENNKLVDDNIRQSEIAQNLKKIMVNWGVDDKLGLENQLGAIIDTIREKDDIIAKLRQTESTSNSELQSNKSRLVEVNKAMNELEKANAFLATRRGSLENEIKLTRSNAERETAKLKREIEDLQRKVQELQSQLEQSSIEIDAAESRAGKEKEELKATIKTLEQDLKIAREESHERRTMENQNRKKATDAMKADKAALVVMSKRTEDLEEEVKQQREVHKARIGELENFYQKQIAKAKSQAEKSAKLAADKQWRDKVTSLEREMYEQRLKDGERLRAELEGQAQRIREEGAHNEKAFLLKIEEMDSEAREQRQAFNRKLQEAQEKECLLLSQTQELQKKIEELEEQRSQEQNRRNLELSSLVMSMEDSLHSISSKLKLKEDEIAALRNIVQRECQERLDLQAKLKRLQGMQARIEPEEEVDPHRSPSCPPLLFSDKRESGWGLPTINHRGPSPAQLYDARVTKERIQNQVRSRRSNA